MCIFMNRLVMLLNCRSLLLLVPLLLSACVAPYSGVVYKESIDVVTQKRASIQLVSSSSGGASASSLISVGSGVFVPINTGPVRKLWFDAHKQQLLIQSLKSTLLEN